MKKLYGIGTGPGDKELLTLKAVKTIKEASVIFAPNNKGKNIALDTAEDYLHNKKVVLIDFPMGKVEKEDYIKAAEIIYNEIPEGEYGAFLTIGDPMVYSTFIYIVEELESKKIDVEIVSGIPSFVASAARTKTPLTVKGDTFILCDEFKEELLNYADSICILKTLKSKENILNTFENNDFKYKYIKRCTWNEEKVLSEREEIIKDSDYISLILGRK